MPHGKHADRGAAIATGRAREIVGAGHLVRPTRSPHATFRTPSTSCGRALRGCACGRQSGRGQRLRSRIAIAGGDPWHAPDLEQLRAALAAGQLPIDHCRGCARWLDAGLPEHAPPVRQHGDLPAVACGRLPTSVVLRLPAGGDFDAAVAASLPHLPQDCDHVTVVASMPLAAGSAWLAALRNAPRTPAIRLAWHG
jgi:hypothetical protein